VTIDRGGVKRDHRESRQMLAGLSGAHLSAGAIAETVERPPRNPFAGRHRSGGMDASDGHTDREWRLIREEAWSGPMNMALDEIAAETAAAGGPRTLRVYRWDPSTLSLGYHQAPETVDWDYCEREGVGVTRRPTGGGGIYHDTHGDISYTIVAPAAELPGDLVESYHRLCTPIFDAFERMGVPAGFAETEQAALHSPACYLRERHPAHDVVVDVDGTERKVSGNAQHRRTDAVVQHGSLTYTVRPERHLAVFADPGPDVTPAAFRERVTGIDEHADISRETAVETLEAALGEWANASEGAWSDDEIARARERASEKYASDEWTKRQPGRR
jgi:lipoate-protein ligase A